MMLQTPVMMSKFGSELETPVWFESSALELDQQCCDE